MPIAVTSLDIQDLITQVNNGNITAGYSFLSANGFHYADWAFGVAQGNTGAGVAALSFLEGTALAGIGSAVGWAKCNEAQQINANETTTGAIAERTKSGLTCSQ